MNQRNLSTIGSILDTVLEAYGLRDAVEQIDYVKHWQGIVGPEIAKRTKVMRFYRGILTVRVVNSSWLQELNFHKETILKRLQVAIESEVPIQDIRFAIGPVS